MKISLCLLVWNEIGGCQIDLPLLPLDQFEEVFAIDGGSNDGTVEYLQAQGITVHAQIRRSLNAAYWQGIETSRMDAVVFFFPKGTLPPADVLQFRPLLESGCQLVVASRRLKGSRNEEDSSFLKPRKWGVQALGLLVSLLWRREGWRVRDVLHGVRAFTVSGFRAMDPSRTGVSTDLETVVRSYRLRLRRAEFPTTEIARPFGETRFKILPTGIKLLQYLGRELKRTQ